MSDWAILNEREIASLVARWTALLCLAWLGHFLLANRNPRWRVALWRAAFVGIAGVGLLTLAPPVWEVPLVSPAPVRTFFIASEVSAPTPRIADPGPSSVEPALLAVPAAAPMSIVPAMLLVWAVGAAALATRLGLAWLALGRIIGRSDEAPARVAEQCRDVAGAIGAPAVRVACSAEVATPCLAGLRRPVLLLPARAMEDDDMRAVLAHELAHARGRDLAWNLVAHLATIVLWFHPLAWRLRSAHASACDAVCDAVAADLLGDVPSYGRTLARLALAAQVPPPVTGLAMARSADIRRRVDALHRKVFRSPLPHSLTLPAALGGGVLLLLIGGVALTEAQPPADAKAPLAAAGRLEIKVVSGATGRPIEGAAVEWDLRVDGGRFTKTTATTGEDGRAALPWPARATINNLHITARKAGFVPYMICWDDRVHPVRLPAVKLIKLVSGVAIGGVVQDEAGRPVAGARIRVSAPPTETESQFYNTMLFETRTDDQGRWRFDDAPRDLSDVNVWVEATRYLRVMRPPSRDLDAVTVLKRGSTVKGRVLDAQGKPVAGARVRVGDMFSSEPEPTTTDARGEFIMENCPPGASVVTVRAEDFAPDLRAIHPEDRPTLEFRLEPGHMLRGKVVDRQRRPVSGVMVAADTWREHRSLEFRVDTDKDGRFEWKSAPGDAVLFSVAKAGYMYRRDVSLTASDEEQVITLDPEFVISGAVTDSATGRPMPAFRVIQGLVFANDSRVSWSARDASKFTDGRYTVKYSEPYAGYAVRIEAAGYKPAESRVFRPGEENPTVEFALTRAEAADLLTGIVLGPDGRPVAGAEVALATHGHPLIFENEQFTFGRRNGMSFTKTGPDGRFTFDARGDAFLLAATSDDGYAEATSDAFSKSNTLDMKTWGKVSGQALIGQRPAANELVEFRLRDITSINTAVHAFHYIKKRTDAQGRFSFDRVIPGAGQVARVVVTDLGNGSQQHMGCWQEPVDVAPGQAVEVLIGGKGRPVIGRVALKALPGIHVDWRQNRPATIEKSRVFNPFRVLFGQDPRQFDRFAGSFDTDGRFRVEDVPTGRYELTVTIDAPPVPNRPGPAQELGRVTVPVNVPEGDADTPIDLGEVPAEVKAR